MNRWEELSNRLETIEKEVTYLKREIQYERQKNPTEVKEIQRERSIQTHSNNLSMPEKERNITHPAHQVTMEEENQIIDWEKELGQKWLPRVFLFVLIMGFIWGFIAAVDGGWITEPLRIMIGFLVSGSLYFFGKKQIHHKRKHLGVVLLSGMVILLSVTTFAMNTLYGYTGFWVTFLLYITWLAIGLYLAKRHDSEVLATLVSVGGLFIPFIVSGGSDQNILLFYVYEAILYGIYSIFASKQDYKILMYFTLLGYYIPLFVVLFVDKVEIQFYLYQALLYGIYLLFVAKKGGAGLHYASFFTLQIVTFVYCISNGINDMSPVFFFWLQHFVLMYLFFFRNYMKASHIYTILLGSLMINITWSLEFWSRTEAEITILIVALVYAALALVMYKLKRTEQNAIATILATLSTAIYIVLSVDSDLYASILLLQGLASIYIGQLLKNKGQWLVGIGLTAWGMLHTLFADFYQWFDIEMFKWFIALAALVLLYYMKNHPFNDYKKIYHQLWMIVTVVWTFIFVTKISNLLFANAGDVTNAIGLSGIWLLYAVTCIVIGRWKQKSGLTILGVLLLFVVLIKLVFVDLSIISFALRAMLFVLLGTIGLVISRFLYQNDKPLSKEE